MQNANRLIYSVILFLICAQSANSEEFSRRLLVKSNAAGWVLGISNIAAEVDLAQHWSFTLPAYYSGWNYFTSTVKFRTTTLQPEFRYWIDETNERWYVGAHFGMAYYNYAANTEYRYQDHEGHTPALGGGVSAGYRLPLTGDRRWRVEFSIGFGVYSLHYDKFYNTDDTAYGLLQGVYRKTFWGIDQIAATFSYSFDLQKKGREE